jgi:hypothetical protein
MKCARKTGRSTSPANCIQSDAKRKHSKSCFRMLSHSDIVHLLKHRCSNIAQHSVSCGWSTPQRKKLDSVVQSSAKSDPISREADPLGPALSTMLAYHFTLRNDGAQVDDLGFMGLADDDEALVFGKQVIRDLKGGDRNYAGWIMDITEGERPVGNIPFE